MERDHHRGTDESPHSVATPSARRIAWLYRELRRIPASREIRPYLWGKGKNALDVGQGDVLNFVGEAGPSRLGDLARALRVDPSTITRAVERLERSGLARRVGSPDDGRGVNVVLTPQGKSLYRRLAYTSGIVFEQIINEFTPEEMDTLGDLLERMVKSIDRFIEEQSR